MGFFISILALIYLISSTVAFAITKGDKSRELSYREVLVLNILQFVANAIVSILIHVYWTK